MKMFVFLFIMSLTHMGAQKIMPGSIASEARMALKHYPELKDVPITFKFKKRIRKSIMLAQPKFGSLFKSRKKRKYVILISEQFQLADTLFHTKDMPSNILIGWLGHELGHVMDYQQRGNFELIRFGINYYFSKRFIQEAERMADRYAVMAGMEQYILETKNFILNQAGISKKYKERIQELYLSPDEIMLMVQEREAMTVD